MSPFRMYSCSFGHTWRAVFLRRSCVVRRCCGLWRRFRGRVLGVSAAMSEGSDMDEWEKLPALEGGARSACLNCPPKPHALPMSTVMAVGFGAVQVTRGDEVVWVGDDEHVWLRRFERKAAADPDHDWRVHFMGPLSESVYQRHGEREWVLVERGMGFA